MTAKITPETLRLAKIGSDLIHQKAIHCLMDGDLKHADQYKENAKAIDDVIAHATEMQEVMKHKARPTTEGWYFWRWWCETSHGVPAQWSPWQVNWFSTETIEAKDHSKNTIETRNFIGPFNPDNFALTETPRPEPTGEMMGEK